MTFIVASKDKYVMLKNQHDSIKLKKNEAFKIDEVNAEYLTTKYEDISYYVASKEKPHKNKTHQDNNSTATDNDLINEAN
jgi:hypothetical protein